MRRTLMIHIPRTAGNSMRVALAGWEGFQDVTHMTAFFQKQQCEFDPDKTFTTIGHNRPSRLVAFGAATDEWVKGCYRVSFVRNPWDRLVSLYFYLRRFRLRGDVDRCAGSNPLLLDFGSFIREVTDPDSPWLHNRKALFSLVRASSQLWWLQEGVDWVGRFERLARDWRQLCEEVGMERRPLKKCYSTKHGHYRDYYDRELRELVARDRAEVIDRFEYVF